MRVRSPNDLAVGFMLIGVAILALFLSRNLAGAGTTGLGPGSLPRLLCGLQILLGGALVATGLLKEGLPLERWVPRPILWVSASVIFFGVSIERLGLVIAVAGLVVLACLANRHTRMVEALSVAVVMTLFSVVIFARLLGQTMAIWPPGLTP